MAYKTLTTQTMVTVSAAWLDSKEERPLIASLPQAGPLLTSIEKVHNGLLQTQASGATIVSEISAVQSAQEELDTLHDRKTRGVFNVLTGFADLADDPVKAKALLALRDRIYTNGLKVVQWSYVDEAGEAALVDERIGAADKDALANLPTPDGSLKDHHEARIDAGKKIGELEKKKIALAATSPAGASASEVVRARNAWIRTVTAFVAMLGLDDLTEEKENKILGPLREAERRADRRGETKDETKGPPTGGAPPAAG